LPQLVPLRFKPGIDRELTRFGNENGWYNCDKVRFRQGFPESIGGWSKYQSSTFLGTCRSVYTWVLLTGDVVLGVGTHLKLYILYGGAYYDITPIRETTAAGDVTFSATDGDTTLTVTGVSHGAMANDFVTFSGATSLGGNVTADVLNQEHQIVTIVDANTYTIELSVTANASDTGNGGASVVGEYQINTGLDTGITGTGWGAGAWGDGAWGEGADDPAGTATLRVWSQDNFGEDLIANPTNGGVYYYDSTNALGTARAVALSDLSGANRAPTLATQVMVSDQDRHVIAFGADGEFDSGTQDPLLIRWSDQENAAEWESRPENTAGSIRLSRGAEIVRAVQTKREIVIFTDTSMHSMQFLGPPYTFGIQEISTTSNIISRIAVTPVDDQLYWMSNGKFMIYDGTVRELPCTVKDYVFSNFNLNQRQKVVAGHNLQFSEVWWFYPSAESTHRKHCTLSLNLPVWILPRATGSSWRTASYLT